MERKKGDVVAALVLLAFALGYALEALRLPRVKYAIGPGPSFLPLLLGVALTGLALALLARALAARRETPDARTAERGAVRRIALILLALVGYSLLFERLGFLLSTTLFLSFLLAMVEPQPAWIVVSLPLTTSVVSYLLFVRWLRIPLPKGLLPF